MNGWVRSLAVVLVLSVLTPAGAKQTLKQNQSTIKGLVVRDLADGNLTGMAMGVVATARGEARNGKISIRGTIGPMMKGSLDEAERFVRVNHPELGNAQIEVSFTERHSPKDGPSAGTAFAVLITSLVEGFEIDPVVGITGDIAVNGEVGQIGGVTAKLKGAKADGCSIAVIPKTNVPAVSDLVIALDPKADRLEILRTMQVFSAETVPDAIAVSRKDRSAEMQEAITAYAEVQAEIEKRSLAGLRDPKTVAKLKRIVEVAPNHVTAQLALDMGQNKGPTTLTLNGSVSQVFTAARNFWEANNTNALGQLTRADCKRMKDDLTGMRRIIHPEVQNLRKAMWDWLDAVDRLIGYRGELTERDKAILAQRRSNLVNELDRLQTDEKLVEKMMREGY